MPSFHRHLFANVFISDSVCGGVATLLVAEAGWGTSQALRARRAEENQGHFEEGPGGPVLSSVGFGWDATIRCEEKNEQTPLHNLLRDCK